MSSHAAHRYDDPTLPPRLCLNCGATLRGPFCSQCGQHDIDYHRSFLHLAHDALENLFHFDGKFLVSVAWLLAKPGRLTAEFNVGRRASQVPPLRFYIFVTVLFFLLVHLLNHGHLLPIDRREADKITGNVRNQIASSPGSRELTPDQQRRLGEAVGKTGGNFTPAKLDQVLREVRDETTRIQEKTANDKVPAPPSPPRPPGRTAESNALDGAIKRKIHSGELTLSRFLDEIEHRVPTLLFIGMPVFALLLKIFYLGRKRFYIEHLVFSLHLHTWFFLVCIVGTGYFQLASLGPRAVEGFFWWAVIGWMLWYILAAFRHVYGQSWSRTVMKVGFLGIAYLFTVLLLTAVMIAATFAWLVYT